MESVEEQADAAREFEENPYQIDNKKPEDIVRLFYIHNVPIIPVISRGDYSLEFFERKTLSPS